MHKKIHKDVAIEVKNAKNNARPDLLRSILSLVEADETALLKIHLDNLTPKEYTELLLKAARDEQHYILLSSLITTREQHILRTPSLIDYFIDAECKAHALIHAKESKGSDEDQQASLSVLKNITAHTNFLYGKSIYHLLDRKRYVELFRYIDAIDSRPDRVNMDILVTYLENLYDSNTRLDLTKFKILLAICQKKESLKNKADLECQLKGLHALYEGELTEKEYTALLGSIAALRQSNGADDIGVTLGIEDIPVSSTDITPEDELIPGIGMPTDVQSLILQYALGAEESKENPDQTLATVYHKLLPQSLNAKRYRANLRELELVENCIDSIEKRLFELPSGWSNLSETLCQPTLGKVRFVGYLYLTTMVVDAITISLLLNGEVDPVLYLSLSPALVLLNAASFIVEVARDRANNGKMLNANSSKLPYGIKLQLHHLNILNRFARWGGDNVGQILIKLTEMRTSLEASIDEYNGKQDGDIRAIQPEVSIAAEEKHSSRNSFQGFRLFEEKHSNDASLDNDDLTTSLLVRPN